MSILDFFKSAPSLSPQEVREYIRNKKSQEYCLIDVRQPAEYEQGHLPGARLIPLSSLPLKFTEMDPTRTTIVYCRSGSRSLSATSLLMSAGFTNVLNMDGGILRYNGVTASGPPEAGMFCFPESLTPGQLAGVAWFLEDGTIGFLEGIRENRSPGEALAVIDDLMQIKSEHKKTLEKLYADVTGQTTPADFPGSVLDIPGENVMVGCVKVSAALQWAEGKTLVDILEFMISLEANAYDLYLKLGRAVKSDEARRVFHTLSEEEQKNIELTSSVYEKTLKE